MAEATDMRVVNATELPHSVELAGNAKGKFAPTVKIYSADEQDAAKRSLAVLDFVRTELRSRGVLAE